MLRSHRRAHAAAWWLVGLIAAGLIVAGVLSASPTP